MSDKLSRRLPKVDPDFDTGASSISQLNVGIPDEMMKVLKKVAIDKSVSLKQLVKTILSEWLEDEAGV